MGFRSPTRPVEFIEDDSSIDIYGTFVGQAPTSLEDIATAPRRSTALPEVDTAKPFESTTELGKDLERQNLIDRKAYQKERLALEGARAGLEIFNAVSKYNSIAGSARFNLMQIENQVADAYSRGQGRALGAQLEGESAGEQSLLALAAQGQDVRGAGAQRVQSSYEALGQYNAMVEEINMYREIYGLELEAVNQNFAVDQAAIQRDMSILGSVAQFGASASSFI